MKKFVKTSGINNNDFIVFDFETGGKDPHTCQPIQIAAMAINARKLTPYPDGTYSSMMRPPGKEEDWNIEQEALDINKKTIEQVREAPGQEQVWKEFASFCKRYNPKNSSYNSPIPCGQNIKGYDMIILQRLCSKYKMVDTNGKQNLLSNYKMVDLLDIMFMWFENSVEPVDYKMDTLRDYFGMSKENSHDAATDVAQTWSIIAKFLKLHRRLLPNIPFKGAFQRAEPAE